MNAFFRRICGRAALAALLAFGVAHARDAVVAKHFMVAAASPLAAQAGADVLERGGSAVDAAIAVQMVLGLVEPESSGIGGGAFMLHWSREEKKLRSYDGRETAPAAARPVVTFPTRTTFHLNGNTVNVVHVNNAHTDGDSIVHFTNANVIHTGDTYMKDIYPFIDISSGGSIDGFIGSSAAVLARADANTKIIPGHGALANKADLQRFHDMLVKVRANIQSLIDQGKTEDEVVAGQGRAGQVPVRRVRPVVVGAVAGPDDRGRSDAVFQRLECQAPLNRQRPPPRPPVLEETFDPATPEFGVHGGHFPKNARGGEKMGKNVLW